MEPVNVDGLQQLMREIDARDAERSRLAALLGCNSEDVVAAVRRLAGDLTEANARVAAMAGHLTDAQNLARDSQDRARRAESEQAMLSATAEAARKSESRVSERWAGTLKALAEALRCSEHDGAIIDAVTRLREENGHLKNDKGSALAEARDLLDRSAAAMGLSAPEIWSKYRTLTSLPDMITYLGESRLKLRRELDEMAAEMARAADPATVAEAAVKVSAVPCPCCDYSDPGLHNCDDCHGCDDCHDEYGCEFDDEDEDDVEDGDKPTEVVPTALLHSLHSLQTVMATDARDWAATRGDAWLYGIVVGWPPAALKDVAEKHRWTPATVDRLRELRRAVLEAHEPHHAVED